MIDCPICHVKNQDDARYCAECGQRLGSPQQSSQPTELPRSAAPPQANPNPVQPPARKLHSPLLSAQDGEPGPVDLGSSGGNEVNRLRQMSTRSDQKPAPAQTPETKFRNPYDPRNNPANTQGLDSEPSGGPASEPPKRRGGLRSPLLSGDDFGDEDPEEYRSSNLGTGSTGSTKGGRGLHSPLLGGGGGGGGANNYDDDYQDDSSGGHNLRSPLLGGGSGGYQGRDRRTAEPQPFSGQERRSGLRSPMLSSMDSYDDDDYYDEYGEEEEDPYAYEDDQTVLRSPLLAARRKTGEQRQPAAPARNSNAGPAAGFAKTDERTAANAAKAQSGSQPTSSFSSLKSISTSGSYPTTSSVPPMPPRGASAQAQPQAGPGPVPISQLADPLAPYATPPRSAEQPLAQAANPPSPPTPAMPPSTRPMVPPEFGGQPRALGVEVPPLSPAPADIPPHQIPPQPTNFQSNAIPPREEPAAKSTGGAQRGRSKMLAGIVDEDDQDAAYPAQKGRSSFAQADYTRGSSSPSPIWKMVGIFAGLLLAIKLYVFQQIMSSTASQFVPWVIDQVVGLLVIIALMVVCFMPKD